MGDSWTKERFFLPQMYQVKPTWSQNEQLLSKLKLSWPKKFKNESPKHPKIEQISFQGPKGPLKDPSKNGDAFQPLYAAVREGEMRSVHYIQCLVRVSPNTTIRDRIGPDPHQVLYIVYGSQVLFCRGFDGFIHRACFQSILIKNLQT